MLVKLVSFVISVVTCSSLPSVLSDGTVSGTSSTYNYQSAVTFTCSAGYYITSEAQTVQQRALTCQNNGQWNANTPTCSRKCVRV